MSKMSEAAREAAKSKAKRLVAVGKGQMVSSADWKPTEPLNSSRKTGKQPITPSNFDGPTSSDDDDSVMRRADRTARASGGRTKLKKIVGAKGPLIDVPYNGEDAESFRKRQEKMYSSGEDKDDRSARASGGRTKGKTNIAIVINAGKGNNDDTGGDKPPATMMRPPAPPMPAAQPPMGAMPPAMAGPPPGAGAPPMMMRKAGGRIPHMTAGAGSGEGRLEKTALQKKDRLASK